MPRNPTAEPESALLTPEAYAHLRRLAHRIHEERGLQHTSIAPTVLLHEAWAKLRQSSSTVVSQRHFRAVVAQAMRQICVDAARARLRAKRGGGFARHTTLSGVASEARPLMDLLSLDEVLTELEALDPRAGQVVMMRTFGGMTVNEIAEALDASTRTVNRTWRFARSFLGKRLGGD